MVSLATAVDRTLYFDYLPLRMPSVAGLGVRLQLFTVPGQVHYNATRKLVLTGADGIVFVADSQKDRLDANLESLENMDDNLREQGIDPSVFPQVIAYNKRDLDDVVSIQELNERLGRVGVQEFATSAQTGEGVYEALAAITQEVLGAFERDRPPKAEPAGELSQPEPGLVAALRQMQAPGAVLELPDSSPPPGFRDSHQAPSESARGSFAALWEGSEQGTARAAEAALAAGEYGTVVEQAGELISRSLALVASSLGGSAGGGRDPAIVALLLGIDGRRYLAFRGLLRRARAHESLTELDGLHAYAFAIEVRLRERD
jgi:signal recognition particle receptor subunit beta